MPGGFSAVFTETAGRAPGKKEHCSVWRVPGRNIVPSGQNFIPSPFTLQGGCSTEKDWSWLSAAVGPGIAIFSKQKAGFLGNFLWLCWKITSLPKPRLQGGDLAELPGFNVGKGERRGEFLLFVEHFSLWMLSL